MIRHGRKGAFTAQGIVTSSLLRVSHSTLRRSPVEGGDPNIHPAMRKGLAGGQLPRRQRLQLYSAPPFKRGAAVCFPGTPPACSHSCHGRIRKPRSPTPIKHAHSGLAALVKSHAMDLKSQIAGCIIDAD